MILEDYNEFYDVVINRCINKITSKQMPKDCLKIRKRNQYKIYKNYQAKRDYVKNRYMDSKNSVALDRHKVASCMIFAILKTKPLIVNRFIHDLPETILLANEYLAFFVALNIIEMYKLDELNGSQEYEIILPRTYHEQVENENTFLVNTCRALYYTRLKNVNEFDVFSYATILFLLERYTDTLKDC